MRHAALATILLTIAAATSNVADAGSSFARSSTFEGHIVFCAGQSDPIHVETLPDGGRILTFVNIGNVWLTGNPLIDGTASNIVKATFPPGESVPPSSVVIRGKVDVAALDGIWLFELRPNTGPNGEGIGFGFGLGDLRGKLIRFETTGVVEQLPQSPCSVPFGVRLTGEVISFHWFS